jgi:hypothetical protein
MIVYFLPNELNFDPDDLIKTRPIKEAAVTIKDDFAGMDSNLIS